MLLGIGNSQALIVVDIDIAKMPHRQSNLLNSLSYGEQRQFIGVARDQNHHPLE